MEQVKPIPAKLAKITIRVSFLVMVIGKVSGLATMGRDYYQ